MGFGDGLSLRNPSQKNPFELNRIKKRESRSEARFRFSDLVNANHKSVYLSREQRDDYHGCGIVLAKELEYISMVTTGRRTVDIDLYNKNRIILGHFWFIQEAIEEEQRKLFAKRITSFKSIIVDNPNQTRSVFSPRISFTPYQQAPSKTPFRRSTINKAAL